MRPTLEVADIFRRHGPAYRIAHDGHLGRVDRRHHLELGKAQVSILGRAISGAGSAEDIGDLEAGAHRLSRVGSFLRSVP